MTREVGDLVDEDDDGVTVHRSAATGSAYLLPSSVKRLPTETQKLLHHMAAIAGEIVDLEEHFESCVLAARSGGASWSHIGAARGITAEGARSGYRCLEEEQPVTAV